MQDWLVVPYEGVGPILLDAPRNEVRAILGATFNSYRKYGNVSLTDAYDSLGIHLYYDSSDRLEFIEVFLPTVPVYEGVPLIGDDLGATLLRLKSMGLETAYAEEGYTFDSIGISLWVPDGEIKGVGVYRRGYYGTTNLPGK